MKTVHFTYLTYFTYFTNFFQGDQKEAQCASEKASNAQNIKRGLDSAITDSNTIDILYKPFFKGHSTWNSCGRRDLQALKVGS